MIELKRTWGCLRPRVIYVVGVAVIVVLIIAANPKFFSGPAAGPVSASGSATLAPPDRTGGYLFSALALFLLLVYMWYRGREKLKLYVNINSIAAIITDNPGKLKRAQELYRIADYHQGRATYSSVAGNLVLIALAIYVSLASYVANRDIIELGSVARLKLELKDRRQLNQWQMPEGQKENFFRDMLALEKQYAEAIKIQTELEAGMESPAYRMASTILIQLSMIGIGIYLVIILNRSYKFHDALASYYRACFLGTLRGDDSIEDFVKYVSLVSAAHIEYLSHIDRQTDRIKIALDKFKSNVPSNR